MRISSSLPNVSTYVPRSRGAPLFIQLFVSASNDLQNCKRFSAEGEDKVKKDKTISGPIRICIRNGRPIA